MSNGFLDIPQSEINRMVDERFGKRRRRERIFRLSALSAIILALLVLFLLLASTFIQGRGALLQSEIRLTLDLSSENLGISGGAVSADDVRKGDFSGVIKRSLRGHFLDVKSRKDKKQLYKLVSDTAAFELLERLLDEPELLGSRVDMWVLASAHSDAYFKGRDYSRLSDKQRGFMDELALQERVRKQFNWRFFLTSDSRSAESAGIAGALIGSAWMMLVAIALAFPLGVMTAVYLEEFAPKNRFTDFIEININTLASVPSIVFGLLGLAAFIEFFGMPRSAPLTGGMVLALMTLPTIIIAARSSLQTVPPSIRSASLAMGASRMQMVLHHVLPLAMPGVLTGSIIGMARALGETAPLLMIGMVAFIIDLPGFATDPSSALPVQIFIWADHPERAFLERTALAILVLLIFLALINSVAVIMRKRLTRRW